MFHLSPGEHPLHFPKPDGICLSLLLRAAGQSLMLGMVWEMDGLSDPPFTTSLGDVFLFPAGQELQ